MILNTLPEIIYDIGKEQSPMYIFALAAYVLVNIAITTPQPFDIIFFIFASMAALGSVLSSIHYFMKVWVKT